MASLASTPVVAGARVTRLVGDEQLDGMAENRVGEIARCRERLILVAECRLEQVVHGGEHLGTGAVVAAEHQRLG